MPQTYTFEIVPGVAAPAGSPVNPLTDIKFAGTVPPEFSNFFSALTGGYTGFREQRYAETWYRLREAGLHEKLDGLCILGLTEADSLADWVGGAAATNVNGSTFDPSTGFTTNGVDQYIQSNVNLLAAANYSQNDCSFGLFVADATPIGSNDYLVGMDISGSFDVVLRGLTSGNTVTSYIQSIEDLSESHSEQTGLWVASREASTQATLYRDGSQVVQGATASSAVRDGNLVIGRQSSSYGSANAAAWFVGAGLNAAEVETLTGIVNDHIAAVQAWAAEDTA